MTSGRKWIIPALTGASLIVGVVLALRGFGRPTPEPPPAEPAAQSAEPTPVPAPQPPPAPVAPAPPAAPPRATLSRDEAALMARLRQIKDSDPAAAIRLARDGNKRFPDTSEAAERASILIHALAAQGASSEARGEAEDMVNRYADDRWVREIEAFTGAHRRRNFRLNDAGQIEGYDPPGVGPSRDR